MSAAHSQFQEWSRAVAWQDKSYTYTFASMSPFHVSSNVSETMAVCYAHQWEELQVCFLHRKIGGSHFRANFPIVMNNIQNEVQTQTYTKCMSPRFCSVSLTVVRHRQRNYSSSARNSQLELVFTCCYSRSLHNGVCRSIMKSSIMKSEVS